MRYFTLAVLLLCCAGCGHRQPTPAQRALPPVSEHSQSIDKQGWVLIAYGRKSCRYCVQMYPIVAALKAEPDHGGYDNLYMIDLDTNPDLERTQGIEATPCYVIYHDGVEADRHTGVHTRAEIVGWRSEL